MFPYFETLGVFVVISPYSIIGQKATFVADIFIPGDEHILFRISGKLELFIRLFLDYMGDITTD